MLTKPTKKDFSYYQDYLATNPRSLLYYQLLDARIMKSSLIIYRGMPEKLGALVHDELHIPWEITRPIVNQDKTLSGSERIMLKIMNQYSINNSTTEDGFSLTEYHLNIGNFDYMSNQQANYISLQQIIESFNININDKQDQTYFKHIYIIDDVRQKLLEVSWQFVLNAAKQAKQIMQEALDSSSN